MILCDSGPLIAAAATNDADHHACTELFSGLRLAGRRLLVPQTVVAEVGYMLATWMSTEIEAKFLDAVAAGDFEVVNLTSADYQSLVTGEIELAGDPQPRERRAQLDVEDGPHDGPPAAAKTRRRRFERSRPL